MVINKREKVKRRQAASICPEACRAVLRPPLKHRQLCQLPAPRREGCEGEGAMHAAVWVFAANLYDEGDGEAQHCVMGVLLQVAETGVSAVTKPLRKGERPGLTRFSAGGKSMANQSHK